MQSIAFSAESSPFFVCFSLSLLFTFSEFRYFYSFEHIDQITSFPKTQSHVVSRTLLNIIQYHVPLTLKGRRSSTVSRGGIYLKLHKRACDHKFIAITGAINIKTLFIFIALLVALILWRRTLNVIVNASPPGCRANMVWTSQPTSSEFNPP